MTILTAIISISNDGDEFEDVEDDEEEMKDVEKN